MVANAGKIRTNTIAASAIVRISMMVENTLLLKTGGLKPNNALEYGAKMLQQFGICKDLVEFFS